MLLWLIVFFSFSMCVFSNFLTFVFFMYEEIEACTCIYILWCLLISNIWWFWLHLFSIKGPNLPLYYSKLLNFALHYTFTPFISSPLANLSYSKITTWVIILDQKSNGGQSCSISNSTRTNLTFSFTNLPIFVHQIY